MVGRYISPKNIVSGALLHNFLTEIASTDIFTPFELPILSLQVANWHNKIGRVG